MGRLTLTLWFTLAAVLGPGWCCCPVAASTRPTTAGQPAPPPAKSCCDHHTPPAGDPAPTNPAPAKPAGCPCGHAAQADALPPAGTADADLTASLRLLDTPSTVLLAPIADALASSAAAPAGPTTHVPALSGRALLAVLSQLRC